MTDAGTTVKPRPVKLTDAELAARARTAIAAAHAQPRFDLADERWIPVVQAGATRTVGLRELLTRAHQIGDIALPHPLLRAALRRYLLALTADIIRADRDRDVDDWQDAHAANDGFSAEHVDELLSRHGEHLYLWHPASPFMQDHRLAQFLLKPGADLPVQDLILHLPSGSSAAWWVKAGEPLLRGGLDPARTAMWLLARWFYAVNGNCADVHLPDGSTVGSQHGGVYAETVAAVSHAFRVDGRSLFRSLLRGLPATLGNAGEDLAGSCAWLDPAQPGPSGNPLYQATINPAAVLLTSRNDAGDTARFVRGSLPLPAAQTKQLRDLALQADRHRMVSVNTAGKLSTVRIAPGVQRTEVLRALHRAGLEGGQLHGVVNSADCWLPPSVDDVGQERLELLLVSKAGTGSSPVWDDIAGVDLPARYADQAHPDPQYVEHVRAAVKVAFDPKDGVRHRLERACCDLFAQPADGGWKWPRKDSPPGRTVQTLLDAGYADWQLRTADELERVLDTTGDDALERWSGAVWRCAREAFADVARPYTTSSRYAPRYAAALRHLTPWSAR